jgi:O-antigen ligase/gamma-glutamylcyclotransferase (GGCT)/AIG2-like uncharacterized protein YtfP
MLNYKVSISITPKKRRKNQIIIQFGTKLLLLTLPFFFIPGGYSDFRTPKELLFQSFAALLILILVISYLMHTKKTSVIPVVMRDSLSIGVIAFLLVAIVSTTHSEVWSLSIDVLINLFLATAIYITMRGYLTLDDAPSLINVIALSAVLTAVVVMIQAYNINLFFPYFTSMRGKEATYALIGNSNTVGTFLMLSLFPMLSHLRTLSNHITKFLFAFSILVVFLGILHTLAMAAIVGMLAGLLFYLLFTLPSNHRPLKLIIGLVLFLGGFFSVLSVSGGISLVNERFAPLLEDGDWRTIFNNRWELWGAAYLLTEEAPLLGHGAGSYAFHAGDALASWYEQNPEFPTHPHYIQYAHNDYLQVAAEMGLLGLAAMLLVFLSVIYRLLIIRLYYHNTDIVDKPRYLYSVGFGTSLFAVAINSLAHFPLRLAVTGYLTLLCVAMLMNCTDVLTKVEQRAVVTKKWRISWSWKNRSIAFLIVVLAVYFVTHHIQSMALYNQYLGRGTLLVNQALHSRTENKWLSLQRFSEAEKFLYKALAVKPNDGKALYFSGIVYLSTKRGNDAINAFNQAERSYRRHELYYGRGQTWMYLMNNREKARRDYMKALSLNPDFELAQHELEKIELNHTSSSRNTRGH